MSSSIWIKSSTFQHALSTCIYYSFFFSKFFECVMEKEQIQDSTRWQTRKHGRATTTWDVRSPCENIACTARAHGFSARSFAKPRDGFPLPSCCLYTIFHLRTLSHAIFQILKLLNFTQKVLKPSLKLQLYLLKVLKSFNTQYYKSVSVSVTRKVLKFLKSTF